MHLDHAAPSTPPEPALRGLAHDLRNMLSPAMLHAGHLAGTGDDVVRTRARRIERSVERALALLHLHMDQSSHAGPGRAAAPADGAGLPRRLGRLVEMACEAATEGFEAGWEVAPARPRETLPDADGRAVVFRVLLNLLHNGARAAPRAEDLLRVRLSARSGTLVADVADRGPGLRPEIADWLRAPHGRRPSVPAGRPDAHGIGLPATCDLLSGIGGSLAVVRTGPGGTTLRVAFPDVLA